MGGQLPIGVFEFIGRQQTVFPRRKRQNLMKPRQFHVCIARFPYGGNGGVSSEVPEIGDWLVTTALKMKADNRVMEQISKFCLSDTPITMTRNRAVRMAQQAGADILLMLDSDMAPDIHLGEPGAQPFWDSSFDFFCRHYDRGPCVIGAPYCGPPPYENVYVFEWKGYETDTPADHFTLDAFSREQAAIRGGIEQVAALPTGLIMYDMRIFDILEPPYFDYAYKDKYEAEKCGTEDVVATRDMSLQGLLQLGYNPVYCNWDAWAGHWKPKCVGKPRLMRIDAIDKKFRDAYQRSTLATEQLVDVGDIPLYGRLASYCKPSENGHATKKAFPHTKGSPETLEGQAVAPGAAPGGASRTTDARVRGGKAVRGRVRVGR